MSANSDFASIRERPGRNSIEVFSTCSQSKDVDKSLYLQNVADVARWSEEAGCKGILVYTDNSIADPDIPPNQEELAHINVVLTQATKEAQNGRVVTAISN
jgi:hypothetical protein